MKQIQKSAFTLIELLVVIAIIGILSTIGFSTYDGLKENAKIARIGAFASQVSKELKMQGILKETSAIGIWNFENNFNDSSGNENTGLATSAVSFEESDNIFLGTHYVSLNNGRIGGGINSGSNEMEEFSISYMIKHPVNGTGYPILFITNLGTTLINTASPGSLTVASFPGTITISDVLAAKRWHHVLFTYKNAILNVWVDGELVETISHDIGVLTSAQQVRIGNYGGGASMYMDNLEIWPIAIDPNF